MNKTNLTHWQVSIKIFLAMKAAVKTGLSQYIYNRKGEPYMRVDYLRGLVSGFKFWDNRQRDKTELVLSVLRTVEV